MHPPIALENLTDEEKDIITSTAFRKLQRSLIIYIPMLLIFGFTCWYINMHYMGLGLENETLREFLNLGLVILTVLPARLMVGAFMTYKKGAGAWQKKVFRGKVQNIGSNHITINNQKVKVDASALSGVKQEDDVVVSTTSNGEIFISLKKVE